MEAISFKTASKHGTIEISQFFLFILRKSCFFLFFIEIQRYGAHPSGEQLQDAGPMCPICHDGYRKPIFLSCKHIFCEDCLSMWLDRERTCPMCRSTVAEDPKWKDGSTSYLVQLFWVVYMTSCSFTLTQMPHIIYSNVLNGCDFQLLWSKLTSGVS